MLHERERDEKKKVDFSQLYSRALIYCDVQFWKNSLFTEKTSLKIPVQLLSRYWKISFHF